MIGHMTTLALTALLSSGALAHGENHGKRSPAKPPSAYEETDWGRAGDPKRVTRTIKIDMNDRMRFTPSTITVKRGETIRFEVVNSGKLLHEMVIGTEKELQEHAALMKKFPDMEHDEPYMVHVDPGKRGSMVWQFTKAGNFLFGCLIPGHFEAGMIGRIQVTP